VADTNEEPEAVDEQEEEAKPDPDVAAEDAGDGGDSGDEASEEES
jgi:hypothetical protein